ncbi:C-X-C chemokine receptor type 3-like [Centropristis striata]|uniref:C-X-C chemokine receptor type 3-like n=1 Tax=Centropristis striata TaxID=184440 RepID=UPI0027E06DC3|nr:C-X-C chemokine receptor type 3-like [Centropristis striata]XP_059196238.1 C-X-C chemokine receptor type 3-like [Centropristis striata]
MEVHLDGFLNQNDSYDYDQNYEYKDEFEPRSSASVLIPVLYSLELVVGLLGNGLLLAVLAQKRQSWRVSDTFILHLSVADILLLVTLPFWAAQSAQQGGWCFGSFLCKISGAVFNINFFCGIFLLLCISMDHYLSIVHGTQLFSQQRPWLAHISCLSAWLVSIFITIPDCIFLAPSNDSEQKKTLCAHNFSQSVTDWKLVSRLLHHTLGFLLPAAAIITCISLILLRLQRSTKGFKKQRALMVILPLVLVFFFCWMPYNIALMVDTSSSHSSKEPDAGSLEKALMFTSALGCLHACFRPLLYFALCGNFRERMLAMLRRATTESEGSLWELGVSGKAMPDQKHEVEEGELKQMTSVDHQVQSSAQC